jgi:hypothetical protein
MEKSIAKKDTIQKGQRDPGKTNPSQPKPQKFTNRYYHSKVVITPSNLPGHHANK